MRAVTRRAALRQGIRSGAGAGTRKKEPPGGGSEVVNREASNRVDRSHSHPEDWTASFMKQKA